MMRFCDIRTVGEMAVALQHLPQDMRLEVEIVDGEAIKKRNIESVGFKGTSEYDKPRICVTVNERGPRLA
jgi:hypothetical protein